MGRRAKRTRRVVGVVPHALRQAGAGLWWFIRHPHALIVSLLIGLTGWAVWSYGQQADAFRVVDVRMPQDSTLKLRQPLAGQNIWDVPLGLVSQELHAQQPWLREVRVVRDLPNAIRITPVLRRPVAQVQLERWYPVDATGFVLPQPHPEASREWVRVTGLGIGDVKPGRTSGNARLQLALRVREMIGRRPASLARRVTEIQVTDAAQIRLMLDDAIEVRCGNEAELGPALQRLQAALKVIARQQLPAAYIDVRFNEPVIGPALDS
jgi:cell division septal protein FtsQ